MRAPRLIAQTMVYAMCKTISECVIVRSFTRGNPVKKRSHFMTPGVIMVTALRRVVVPSKTEPETALILTMLRDLPLSVQKKVMR